MPTSVHQLLLLHLAPHVVAQQHDHQRFGCADDQYIIEAERVEAAGWTDETLSERQASSSTLRGVVCHHVQLREGPSLLPCTVPFVRRVIVSTSANCEVA